MWQEYFSDWEFVLSLMPAGWKEQVYNLGLLKFGRKFVGKSKEESLLRVLLLHLVTGASLRETAAMAKQGKLAYISDVGILKRLKKSRRFFEWALSELLVDPKSSLDRKLFQGHRFRLFDATIVNEPGATGSNWRLHFGVDMQTLCCDEVMVTDYHTGETLHHFHFKPGDVAICDRAYAGISGIDHVVAAGADVLLRFSPQRLPLLHPDGTANFPLMKHLRALHYNQLEEWETALKTPDGHLLKGRVCAMRRSPGAAQKERDTILREARKKGRKVSDKTIELADYMLLFTTLDQVEYSTSAIMKLYRLRWQVEILFKRLKSILNLGHLHKYDKETILTWLTGKIFTAILIDKIIRSGDAFSPWEYSG